MVPDKGVRLRVVISDTGTACSKGVSSAFGQTILRVDIAPTIAAGKLSAGGVTEPVARGGPVNWARRAAANKRGAIGDGFRWSFFPSRTSQQNPRSRNRRLPRRARASAQGQNLTIFQFARVSAPAATCGSRSPRLCRRNASVRVAVGERYATCSIGKPAIDNDGATAIGHGASARGQHRRGRRDVFTRCALALASG